MTIEVARVIASGTVGVIMLAAGVLQTWTVVDWVTRFEGIPINRSWVVRHIVAGAMSLFFGSFLTTVCVLWLINM